MQYTKKLLKDIGIEPERLEMFNMSSSQAPAFAEAVREMTRRAKELGPLLIKAGRPDKKTPEEPPITTS